MHMITSKKQLKEYIAADYNVNKFSRISRYTNSRCQFLRILRKLEFLINTNSSKLLIFYYRRRLSSLSERLGITIWPNCFGKGLYIPHYGSIVVNENAKFGDNCIIQNGVNVSEGVVCGKGIYLGAGAKILTGVRLADNTIVGANAVVTKIFEEDNIVIAGIPAKKISNKGRKSGRTKI